MSITDYEIRQEGQTYRCGRKLPDGKVLFNAMQLPADTALTLSEVEPVLADVNRQLYIQYLERDAEHNVSRGVK